MTNDTLRTALYSSQITTQPATLRPFAADSTASYTPQHSVSYPYTPQLPFRSQARGYPSSSLPAFSTPAELEQQVHSNQCIGSSVDYSFVNHPRSIKQHTQAQNSAGNSAISREVQPSASNTALPNHPLLHPDPGRRAYYHSLVVATSGQLSRNFPEALLSYNRFLHSPNLTEQAFLAYQRQVSEQIAPISQPATVPRTSYDLPKATQATANQQPIGTNALPKTTQDTVNHRPTATNAQNSNAVESLDIPDLFAKLASHIAEADKGLKKDTVSVVTPIPSPALESVNNPPRPLQQPPTFVNPSSTSFISASTSTVPRFLSYLPPHTLAASRNNPHPSAVPLVPIPVAQQSAKQAAVAYPPTMTQEVNELVFDLQSMTVDRLKLTIKRINQSRGTYSNHLRISGVKIELIQRIKEQLYSAAIEQEQSRFRHLKKIINETKDAPYTNSPVSSTSSSSHNGGNQSYGYSSTPNYQRSQVAGSNTYSGHQGIHNGHHRAVSPTPQQSLAPNPNLPPPRFNNNHSLASTQALGADRVPPSAAAWTGPKSPFPIKFRESPFFRIEKTLTGVTTLNKAGQSDRKVGACTFSLDEVDANRIKAGKTSPSNPQYQIRLYCTSEDFWLPGRTVIAAPIDFPQTCEIRLNAVIVQANTKGIKKHPGTAPPACLSNSPALSMIPPIFNRAEVIYVNTEKRYFAVIYLVEVLTVPQVLDRLKRGKKRSKEEVIEDIIRMNADPDVQATALGLSLKDPLTFARIKIPMRSKYCNHIGCFDAFVYFTMNEQVPSWSCPICSKSLRFEDMTIDCYFEDILNSCPSSVDEVIVEPDGTWRTLDGRYGTSKSKNPSRAVSVTDDAASPSPAEGKGKIRAEELTLDSDDEAPLAKRPKHEYDRSTPLSVGSTPVATTPTRNGNQPARRVDVIDLTASDSEDERGDVPAVAPPRPTVGRPRLPVTIPLADRIQQLASSLPGPSAIRSVASPPLAGSGREGSATDPTLPVNELNGPRTGETPGSPPFSTLFNRSPGSSSSFERNAALFAAREPQKSSGQDSNLRGSSRAQGLGYPHKRPLEEQGFGSETRYNGGSYTPPFSRSSDHGHDEESSYGHF